MINLERLLEPDVLLSIPVFLFSLTVHECAHALVAWWGGDDTASLQGRITLNPVSHIDPIGTILMPLLNMLTDFPLLGWAKPVPVNPMRLKNSLWMVYVAVAGPASNLLIALTTVILLKITNLVLGPGNLPQVVIWLGFLFISINIGLAVFNMIPVPPLDGSRVLFHFGINGKPQLYPFWESVERYRYLVLYLIILLPLTSGLLRNAVLAPTKALLKVAFS